MTFIDDKTEGGGIVAYWRFGQLSRSDSPRGFPHFLHGVSRMLASFINARAFSWRFASFAFPQLLPPISVLRSLDSKPDKKSLTARLLLLSVD
jgi:hypothetical protein